MFPELGRERAIVMDNLTPGSDTGIFTRKSDGTMNNKGDVTEWVQWDRLG